MKYFATIWTNEYYPIVPDDLGDAKNQLADMNRRLHELELELRRLENEREELAAAYKEAEAVSINTNIVIFCSDFSRRI